MNLICPNCGSPQTPYLVGKDENRNCSDTSFHWYRCDTCGVASIGDPPADLGMYYGSDYYAIPARARLEELATRENAKMAAVLPYVKEGKLLEIGPAFGVFTRRARQEGFAVTVIERDQRCCEHLKAMGDVEVVNADDPVAAMEGLPQFDVIALWHVIEHLPAPFAFLDAAARHLRPGGVLALAAPNPASWQFKVMGAHWPHLDSPRHLHLLPASAITSYCESRKLELLRLVTDDSDAKSWNRFGWQRLLMNRLPGKLLQYAGFVVGALLAAVLSSFESGQMRGSAYTLTLRKQSESNGENPQ